MRLPTLSIIIPARNEAGHLKGLVQRFTGLEGVTKEVIFVEGHSQDATWQCIEEIVKEGAEGFRLRACRQTGKGKGDAVRRGFAIAEGEVLAIFDADLSTLPEHLASFYFRYAESPKGLLMGERFTLPMEKGAMRPLNRLGNRFFAHLLSLATGTSLTDVLCGTKLLAATDYKAILALGAEIAEKDPFGDFHLILGAAFLGLPLSSHPVSYRTRSYGTTNISRFRDGWRLLCLIAGTWRALRRSKLPATAVKAQTESFAKHRDTASRGPRL